jgi:ElaB/YqjD/DUF883 family membrane-anchored ribosome-binding protein
MNTMTRTRPSGDTPHNLAEQAAETASHAIRSTQDMSNAALDRLNDRVEAARDVASPALDRWSSQAETAVRRSADAVRETAAQLRNRAHQVSYAAADRVRDDPLKAVAIAAVAGAVLMGLFALFGRNRDAR